MCLHSSTCIWSRILSHYIILVYFRASDIIQILAGLWLPNSSRVQGIMHWLISICPIRTLFSELRAKKHIIHIINSDQSCDYRCLYSNLRPKYIHALFYLVMFTLDIFFPSESYAASVRWAIDDNRTYNISHYHAHYYTAKDSGTSHISVLSPDGQAVSVTS